MEMEGGSVMEVRPECKYEYEPACIYTPIVIAYIYMYSK